MNKIKIKLKKGDKVAVTAGKDRGREGKIERIFPKDRAVLVPGLNQYKKHRKPQGEGRPGEILTLDRPINISKVAVICSKCKQQTRIGYRILDNKKQRICQKCKQLI
jgi:large subunit ribosomal protein L24